MLTLGAGPELAGAKSIASKLTSQVVLGGVRFSNSVLIPIGKYLGMLGYHLSRLSGWHAELSFRPFLPLIKQQKNLAVVF